ncbi:uncharacterized protein VICG_00239 [Vittaforma corneae ATCC 50505]|uniref:Uncharacterized protein n=1 Tax=Vittaforma corneae (strain ATCC 50505) TaxID=993615 RepID=L2GQM1_VITCO|nr:uncharacterized protein VICG_00239 [Vittaforma corneae ATCC 50505]ELA42924.1 hypothetical protein VICG_00239 [Vittaforma corneae ATCC 50505]
MKLDQNISILKIARDLLVLMGVARLTNDLSEPGTNPPMRDAQTTTETGLFDSSDEEPEQTNDFPQLPSTVVSEIAGIPLFSGTPYTDVFSKINGLESTREFSDDISALTSVLLRIDDQQFFDFCMQQTYFPGSTSELKDLFEKLGIYNNYTFIRDLAKLVEVHESRERHRQYFEKIRDSCQSSPSDSLGLPRSNNITVESYVKYYSMRVITINDLTSQEILFPQNLSISWWGFWKDAGWHLFGFSSELPSRFFRFIHLLCNFSIKSSIQNKESKINNLKIIFAGLRNADMRGALLRRVKYIQKLRCLRIFGLTGIIPLHFPNPEKILDISIQSYDSIDLRGDNSNWLLKHQSLEILTLNFGNSLLIAEEFTPLKQLEHLKQLIIVCDKGKGNFNTAGCIIVSNPEAQPLADGDQMRSLTLKELKCLKYLSLTTCSLDLLNVQEVPSLSSIDMTKCKITSLALQKMPGSCELRLNESEFYSIAIHNVTGPMSLVVSNSSFDLLSLRSIDNMKCLILKKCTFKSINMQKDQHIDKFYISNCDLSKDSSGWKVLVALRSLKALVVYDCKGVLALPYEISEMGNLKALILDLRNCESISVEKFSPGSEEHGDDISLNESFRFPKTLNSCELFIKDDHIQSIPAKWFENCDLSHLRLVINEVEYEVAEDCQTIRRK